MRQMPQVIQMTRGTRRLRFSPLMVSILSGPDISSSQRTHEGTSQKTSNIPRAEPRIVVPENILYCMGLLSVEVTRGTPRRRSNLEIVTLLTLHLEGTGLNM